MTTEICSPGNPILMSELSVLVVEGGGCRCVNRASLKCDSSRITSNVPFVRFARWCWIRTSADRLITEHLMLFNSNELIVSVISLGSQVVNEPTIKTTSLLVWVGICLVERKQIYHIWYNYRILDLFVLEQTYLKTACANSSEFKSDGSPTHVTSISFFNASKCTFKLLLNSEMRSPRLFLVTIKPIWLIGFWSKNSFKNISINLTVQMSRFGLKSRSFIVDDMSSMRNRCLIYTRKELE